MRHDLELQKALNESGNGHLEVDKKFKKIFKDLEKNEKHQQNLLLQINYTVEQRLSLLNQLTSYLDSYEDLETSRNHQERLQHCKMLMESFKNLQK